MNRKKGCLAAAIFFVFLTALLLFHQTTLPGWDVPEELTLSQRRRIAGELTQAAKLCREAAPSSGLSQSDIDALESCLLTEGFSVIDSDALYPEHLGNPESLYAFWAAVTSDTPTAQTVLRVNDDGSLSHLFFHHGKEDIFVLTVADWANGSLSVRECNVLPLYDMELTDWGIFYYRVYPADDPHYIDYAQLRLTPVDRKLYDLTRTYILPVGYQLVNLFLCDWQEGDWGSLSFNDLLDGFYLAQTGGFLPWEQYPFYASPARAMIPAQLFEDTLLPYFDIPLETFRTLCRYDAEMDSYPFRPIYGNDLTVWHYPMCEPLVTSSTENPDGTLTLNVQVYSPELKTDNLFSHTVTVRPNPDGTFQYVSNQLTYVSPRGLPPAMPRFDLDGGCPKP